MADVLHSSIGEKPMPQAQPEVSVDYTEKLRNAASVQTKQEFLQTAKDLKKSDLANTLPQEFYGKLDAKQKAALKGQIAQYDQEIRNKAGMVEGELQEIQTQAGGKANEQLSAKMESVKLEFQKLQEKVGKAQAMKEFMEAHQSDLQLLADYHEVYKNTPFQGRSQLRFQPKFQGVADVYARIPNLIESLPLDLAKEVNEIRKNYEVSDTKNVVAVVGKGFLENKQKHGNWFENMDGMGIAKLLGTIFVGFAALHSAFQKDWGKAAGLGFLAYFIGGSFREGVDPLGDRAWLPGERRKQAEALAKELSPKHSSDGEPSAKVAILEKVNFKNMKEYFEKKKAQEGPVKLARTDASGEKIKTEKTEWETLKAAGVIQGQEENPFRESKLFANLSPEDADKKAGNWVEWLYDNQIRDNNTRTTLLLEANRINGDATKATQQKETKKLASISTQ